MPGMKHVWLHRYSVLWSFCTWFLVIAGGLVTSNDAGLSVPDWPLSYGKLMPPMEGNIFYEHGHRMVATTVGLLTIGMVIWLLRSERRRWVRNLGWISLAAVVAQGVLGGMTVIFMLPRPVSIGHACLAQLFFSTTVALVLFTSESWNAGAQVVDDAVAPPLHWLALAAACCVFLQLALGASARHKAIGVLPHVIGALVATGMVLWLTVRVLMRHAGHAAMRKSALVLLSITLLQVFLGIAAYMSRLATAGAPQPMPIMVGFTVAHVAVGALTLAASVVLAIQVFRNVRRPLAEMQHESMAVTSA
jgi:cytochrome c oxidase assembly protein subunit 15